MLDILFRVIYMLTISRGYTYDILIMDIDRIKLAYPFVEVGSIGKSVMGRNIPYLRIGTGEKEVFYSGSIHR